VALKSRILRAMFAVVYLTYFPTDLRDFFSLHGRPHPALCAYGFFWLSDKKPKITLPPISRLFSCGSARFI